MNGQSSSRMLRGACVALGAVLTTAAIPVAAAKPGTRTIVLEAHVGKRSAQVAAAMAIVRDELERHGFAARPESIRRVLGGRMPQAGRLDQDITIADIKHLIAAGRSAFDKGLLVESESALRRAVELIERNPALLVLDTNNEAVTYSAFVSLSKTLDKRGHKTEADGVMLDLLRVSSMPIPQLDYGPRAQDLHADAEKLAQAMGRGSLTISVSDSRAMIFVDYTYRGLGQVALGDQLPGAHHVLIQPPGSPGLQYVRSIQPGAKNSLDVNWQVESTLQVDESSVGLQFATEVERAKEWGRASELPRSLDGADVIILFEEQVNEKPYLRGIQYPASGDEPIAAEAPMDQAGLLRSLGTYLYNGTMAAGLRVFRPSQGSEDANLATVDSDTARTVGTSTLWRWVPATMMGAGVLTIAGGAIQYARSPFDRRNPPSDGTDGRNPTVEVMLGGSVVLGGSFYFWSRESLSASPLEAGMLSTGIGSIASGIELYLVHQEPSPALPRYIRGTATAGVVVGTTGIALAGAGLWLLHRDRDLVASPAAAMRPRRTAIASWAPVLSAGSSDAFLGCAGSF